MKPAKVDVLVALFAYSGNGGVASTIPEIGTWLAQVSRDTARDERIDRFGIQVFCDTPITMTRNMAVEAAQKAGFDFVLMLDSDNQPDGYLGIDPNAVPFWKTSFDFAYSRMTRGLPTLIAAPYCGPPPHPRRMDEGEVPYLFEWLNRESPEAGRTIDRESGFKLHRLNRNEAALISGIYPMAALPTGVSLFSLSCFDLIKRPYFYYEFNEAHTQKNSTEDVTCTRDIAINGFLKHGEPVVFANCSSWALHAKVKYVGKPSLVCLDHVAGALVEGVKLGFDSRDKKVFLPDDGAGPRFVGEPTETPSASPGTEANPKQEAEGPLLPDANGLVWQKRMIGPHVLNVCGVRTPDEHLVELGNLVEMAAQGKNRPLRMLEIGSWLGESAVTMIHAAPKGSVLFCVDTWKGSPTDHSGEDAADIGRVNLFEVFKNNVKPYLNEQIKPVMMRSEEFAAKCGESSSELDMVFIDGEHTYKACKRDIAAWRKHLIPGGLICGHDYCDQYPGVKKAVKEAFGNNVHVIDGTSIWVASPDTALSVGVGVRDVASDGSVPENPG